MLSNIRMAQKIVDLLSKKVRNKTEISKQLKIEVPIYLSKMFFNIHSQMLQNTMHSMAALRIQPVILEMSLQDIIPT